ncbi:hypothetical protein C943_03115 [Mariniradius saccharolyticus AK6]|uniref:Uncharacterized protein n=1 Tax=Mariniradius saccharolyticus AK6 TaxID=1239962 RepID=M7X7Y1_9BACT|nr:hypothetical protein C943_03115 [Mariniradius saccharolyticus AK6]
MLTGKQQSKYKQNHKVVLGAELFLSFHFFWVLIEINL